MRSGALNCPATGPVTTRVESLYDCLIIGGGPAGLSAAVYMGRFLRRTLIVDAGDGRSSFAQVNDNYLGFPSGIPVRELRRLGREQAERFGVEIRSGEITRIERDGDIFVAHNHGSVFRARTVILCTGVEDIWPDIPNVESFVGKTLFWCIACDGFRTSGKRIVVLGAGDEAATDACQFKLYTDEITLLAAPNRLDCSEPRIKALEENGIEIVEGQIKRVQGLADRLECLELDDGRQIPCDLIFSLYGYRPRVELARSLGAELTSKGFVRVDEDGYTTVPGLFCAGDVSGLHTHQVCSAVHEGAEAAQTANYYLYSAYQKYEFHTPEQDVKPHLELR
jgi:thioredoxin reductase (NADPH)